MIRLEPGDFVILDVDDAHRSGFVTEEGVQTIKKIVIKSKI